MGTGAILVGLIALLFADMANAAIAIFRERIAATWWLPLIVTPAGVLLIVTATRRFTPEGKGSGIPQVVAATNNPESSLRTLISLRVGIAKLLMTAAGLLAAHESLWFGPGKFAATLLSTVAGLPGGIFSPSLATGAGVGNLLCLVFPKDPRGAVVLLGMVAYFTGVVRAPLTAVIIIVEATASRGMILPLFASALIADSSARLVCKDKLYHALAREFLGRAPTEPAST
jgi:H+/Cl- antiporter ClcA